MCVCVRIAHTEEIEINYMYYTVFTYTLYMFIIEVCDILIKYTGYFNHNYMLIYA